MPRASAWVGVAAAVVLAGCGEAEVTGPRAATSPAMSPTTEAGAPGPEAPAPVFFDRYGDLRPTSNMHLVPDGTYDLRDAQRLGILPPAVMDCAMNSTCADHLEARYTVASHLAFLDIHDRSDDLGLEARLREESEALSEAFDEALSLDLEDSQKAVDCINWARDCEITPMLGRSEAGEFDAIRETRAALRAREERFKTRRALQMNLALREFRELASLGNASANSTLGVIRSQAEDSGFGLPGVTRDDTIAVGHLIAAADKGDPHAAYVLAQMIHVGRAGPTHDVDKLLRQAYRGGMEEAGHILLQRQRGRGAVDPKLEAELEGGAKGLVGGIYARGNWEIHPDKPETKVAAQRLVERETQALLEKLESEEPPE